MTTLDSGGCIYHVRRFVETSVHTTIFHTSFAAAEQTIQNAQRQSDRIDHASGPSLFSDASLENLSHKVAGFHNHPQNYQFLFYKANNLWLSVANIILAVQDDASRLKSACEI